MAAARNRQSRRETDHSLPYADSGPGPSPGAADCLSDAAHKSENAHLKESVNLYSRKSCIGV